MNRNNRSPFLQIALIAAVVAFGIYSGILALDSFLDPFDDSPFTAAAWAAANAQARAPMAREAIKQLPPGTGKDRVLELLGQGETNAGAMGSKVDDFGEPIQYAETWRYYLGGWSMYGLDSAYLCIHFGPDGKVVKAEIKGV